MSLFGFLREVLERDGLEAPATPPPAPPIPRTAPEFDPVTRVLAQAFVRHVAQSGETTYDEALGRFSRMPIHSVCLVHTPAGWVALAQQMGISPRVTVH